MSRWSINFTRSIREDLAYFVTKHLPTIPTLHANNLYNAIVKANHSRDYVKQNICIVNTNSGWYVMIKCDTEERLNNVYSNILAMHKHYKEVLEKLNNIKQLE